MADYTNTVISLANQKASLLYYEYVIPGSIPIELGKEYARLYGFDPNPPNGNPEDIYPQWLVTEPLPPELRTEEFRKRLNQLNETVVGSYVERLKTGELVRYDPRVDVDAKLVRDFIDEHQLHSVAVDAPVSMMTGTSEPEMAITLTSLRLVETCNIGWARIREVRSDKEAMAKMRRFRLFAYENYEGKSQAYVEDDILTRVSDYEDTVKKLGFETKSAAFTALLNSDLVKAGLAGSFVAALFHEPITALASAAGGIGLTLGRVAVELGMEKFALREVMRENPVSYITYAKDKLTHLSTN